MMRIQAAFVFALSLLAGFAQVHAQENGAVREQLERYYFDAARAGDNTILQEFIDAGYDLESADEKGYTALILAAYNGQRDTVTLLLEAGANACTEDNRGNTALMGAIFKGELRIARQLLKADCDPDQRNHAGQTPAMFAALFQRLELLDELAQQGADLHATDLQGNSAARLVEGEFGAADAPPHAPAAAAPVSDLRR